MEIKRDEHGRKGAFYVEEEGEWIAELTYTKHDGAITIENTEVDEKLRGQGIGEKIVRSAVEYARESGLKIKLDCPYARKVVERAPELQDVVEQ